MHELLNLIKSSQNAVCLTGAGISTLSGIADFRGKNGFYKRQDIDTDKLFDINYFTQNPNFYYTHAKDFIYNLAEKIPNIVHQCLAQLEKQNLVQAVLTQNIDLLHQKAGSKNLYELHGSPSVHYCLNCKSTYSYDFIVQALKKEANKAPKCLKCGGIIKPKIVFFGEGLDVDCLLAAESYAKSADLFIVLGSSLTVYPVAALPEIALKNKAKLVIINEDPTHLDKYASFIARDLEEEFTKLYTLL